MNVVGDVIGGIFGFVFGLPIAILFWLFVARFILWGLSSPGAGAVERARRERERARKAQQWRE